MLNFSRDRFEMAQFVPCFEKCSNLLRIHLKNLKGFYDMNALLPGLISWLLTGQLNDW